MLLKESLPKAKVKACKVISNAFGTFQNLSCSSPRHTHPCPGTCTHTHTQTSQPCMKVNVFGWGWHPRHPPAGCTLHQTPPVELHKPPLLLSGWVSPDSSSLTLTQWAGLRWGLSASEPHFLSCVTLKISLSSSSSCSQWMTQGTHKPQDWRQPVTQQHIPPGPGQVLSELQKWTQPRPLCLSFSVRKWD